MRDFPELPRLDPAFELLSDLGIGGFRGVYVFDRLSRDLRLSLCAPDGFRL